MIWVLTQEFNDYDQHGEYYVKAFDHKPTHVELTANGVPENRLKHTLDGGGRTHYDDHSWYFLREEK